MVHIALKNQCLGIWDDPDRQGVLALVFELRHMLKLRARCRPVLLFGIGFVAAHPNIHRSIKVLYRLIPGLQTRLRRFLPANPVAGAGPSDVNERYTFKPPPLPAEAPATLTVEHLYHLSRQL